MKIFTASCLLVFAGLLASCCCPRHGQWHHSAGTVKQPRKGDGKPVSQAMVLPYPNPLPVTPRSQEGFYSCWAASAEMIMEFIGGVRVRQCIQAGRSSDGSVCCDADGDLIRYGDCDSPGLPDFGRWGYDSKQRSGEALTWAEVLNEIDGGRPFAFSRGLTDPTTGKSQGISHMLVVIGYEESNGQKVLLCLDPRPLSFTRAVMVPFEEYTGKKPNASGGPSIHEHDFFRIKPSPYNWP